MTISPFITSPQAKEFAERSRPRANSPWSFLTWAFFISQLVGSEQFVSSAAAAAEEPLDLRTPPIFSSTVEQASPPHMAAVSGSHVEESAYQAESKNEGVGHAAFANAPLSSHYAAIGKSFDSSRLAELNKTGALGSAGDRPDDAGHKLNDLYNSGAVLDTPLLQDGIGYLDTIISDVLNETVRPIVETIDNLIGSVSGSLDGIPDLLPNNVETLVSTVGNAQATLVAAMDPLVTHTVPALLQTADHVIQSVEEPVTTVVIPVVTSTLGDVLGNHMHHGQPDVGSSGHIEFATVIPTNGVNDLFSQGLYTDYHLALRNAMQADINPDLLVSGGSSTGLLDHILVGGVEHNRSQDENTSLPFASQSVIEEISQRSLGDGISH